MRSIFGRFMVFVAFLHIVVIGCAPTDHRPPNKDTGAVLVEELPGYFVLDEQPIHNSRRNINDDYQEVITPAEAQRIVQEAYPDLDFGEDIMFGPEFVDNTWVHGYMLSAQDDFDIIEVVVDGRTGEIVKVVLLDGFAAARANSCTISSVSSGTKYSQRDSRWSSNLLGNSSVYTIGSDGCLLTSYAMVYHNAWSTSTTPMLKTIKKLNFFFLLAVAALIFLIVNFWQNTKSEEISFPGSYEVKLNTNPNDANKTEVFLLNIDGTSQVFETIENVHIHHYHPAEFVNGNLYIIRRFGDTNTDNWTDQLWKYQTTDNGVKLYEGKGLDFRVAPNSRAVSVFADASPEEVIILDPTENTASISLSREVLSLDDDYSLTYLSMTNDELWLSEIQGRRLVSIIKYDFDTEKIQRWDIANVGINKNQSDLNPKKLLLVFSDYQFAFDQETENDLEDSLNSLYLYDLNDGSKQLLISSAKRHLFEPKWISESKIEFNSLDENGREQVLID